MKASNPGKLKTDIEYMFDPLVTSSDLYWPLVTPNDLKLKKLQKYGFLHIKRKLETQAMWK